MIKKLLMAAAVLVIVTGCTNSDVKKDENKTVKEAVKTEEKKEIKTESTESAVLKKFGDMTITEHEYQIALQRVPADSQEFYKSPEGKEELLKSIMMVRIMAAEAKKENLDKQKEFAEATTLMVERELANYFVKVNFVDKEVMVTDEEIKAEYEKNKEKYKVGESVRASHILIPVDEKMGDAEKAAQKAKAEAILVKAGAQGADFAALAKEFSSCPSKENGGDLGYFTRGEMVEEFEAAAFEGEAGKVLPKVVQTSYGYHIIKVVDKKGAGYKEIADVKEELKESLINEKRMALYTNMLADFEKRYGVKLQ